MPVYHRAQCNLSVVLLLATASCASVTPAQQEQRLIVSGFAEAVRAGDPTGPSAARMNGIASNPRRYPEALVSGVLDELVSLAKQDSSPRVRLTAVAWLASFGSPHQNPAHHITGVANRLGMLAASPHPEDVRSAAIHSLSAQRDTAAAVRILQDIAIDSERGSGESSFSYDAINSLLNYGEKGRSVLTQLHQDGAVRDPMARGYLDKLAREAFRR